MKKLRKKIIIISLDAFRFDYLDKTVFLKSLADKNRYGELQTVFGYTGIGATVATGKLQNETGVWLEYKRSCQFSIFGFLKYISFLDIKIVRLALDIIYNLWRRLIGRTYLCSIKRIPFKALGKFEPVLNNDWGDIKPLGNKMNTIIDHLRDEKISFKYYDWPVEANNNKVKINFFTSNNDKSKINRLIKNKNKADVFWLRIWDLDSLSHKFGPNSKEVDNQIKKVDYLCQKLFQSFGPETEFLFWSDHGMLEVKGEIDLSDIIKTIKGEYFLDSTLARFWPIDKVEGESIKLYLSELSDGCILQNEDYNKYNLPDDKKYGEIIFKVNAGYVIKNNFYNKNMPKGMHGYNPQLKEQKALYITSFGKGIKNINMNDIKQEIYNLIKQ